MFSPVCITSLEVKNLIESVHFPVVMAINVLQHPALIVDDSKIVRENGQIKSVEKIIWQGDKEQIYADQLSSDKVQSDFAECLTSAC